MSHKIRVSLLVLFSIGFLLSGWKLIELPLWEYWTLLFLGSFWAIILLVSGLRKGATSTSRRRLSLSLVSGVLLAISFPPFPFPYLIFIGFVPLYRVWKEIKMQEEKPLRKFWWYAYNAFVVWNILATFWVSNAALLPGIFAIWVNSLFMTVPVICAAWCSQKVERKWHWLAWTMPWIAFEYGHFNWELSWPWLTLGHAFAGVPYAIQWYSILGVLGGSFWILLVNYLLAERVYLRHIFQIEYKRMGLPVLIIGIPIVISVLMYFSYVSKEKTVNFAILQPNYEPHYEKFEISQRELIKEVIDLMNKAVTDTTDYVLLPETVFNNIELTDYENQLETRYLERWLEKHPEVVVVMGLGSYEVVQPEDSGRYTRKLTRRYGQTLYYEMQNSAVAFDGSRREVYFKSKFVPGAEIFPYSRVLFFLKPLVDMLGGSLVGYEPQEEVSVFTLGPTTIAPLICYESIYPEYVSGFVKKGAKVIAIMTNDGWWGNTLGYRQHNAYARLLAIEMGRDIVRSANTGISSVINARGDILQATSYDELTFINASVSERKELTFYVRWGNLVGKLAAVVSLILFIVILVLSFRKVKGVSGDDDKK